MRVTVASSAIVIAAPRAVLRLGGFFNADYSHKNSQYECRKLHGDLSMTLLISSTMIFVAHADESAADCGEYRQAAGAFAEAAIRSVE
jgi:hypothetical protein